MPRTRPELDRAEKQAAILDVAERQLRTGGFGALSVAGIARELRLAQNAVYWYYPSKDHLFVAAVERMGMRMFEVKHKARGEWIDHLLAVVDSLADLYPLLRAIQERAASSDVVAAFERRLLAQFRTMLAGALAGQVPAADRKNVDLAAESVLAAVLGAYAMGLSRPRRAAMLRSLIARLTTPTT